MKRALQSFLRGMGSIMEIMPPPSHCRLGAPVVVPPTLTVMEIRPGQMILSFDDRSPMNEEDLPDSILSDIEGKRFEKKRISQSAWLVTLKKGPKPMTREQRIDDSLRRWAAF